MNRSIRERKGEIITVRCTRREKETLKRYAERKGRKVGGILLDCGMAGLERKREKDKRRAEMLVVRQQHLNGNYLRYALCTDNEEILELLYTAMNEGQKEWEF